MSKHTKISQDKLDNVVLHTNQLIDTVNEGVLWVETHLRDEHKANTGYRIKQYRRKLKKIKAVVNKKPSIALFGASQVGKSYMANNLLYNQDNKLMVYNHSGQKTPAEDTKPYDYQLIDFIKYLNPEGGGKESTATVTRFTSDGQSDPERLPIRIRLFGPKDIACILCDTYNAEYTDQKPLPGKDAILEFVKEVHASKTSEVQQELTDDDIYEIKEYLEKYFDKGSAFVQNLRSAGFWDTLADNIKYIAANRWTDALEILWNQHPEISNVYRTCVEAFKRLEFASEAFTTFESIIRDTQRSIVNVKTLLEFFFNDDKSYKVQLCNGQQIDMAAGKLCLLTAEIVLSVSPGTVENRPFIENVDIIDFPGARSRDKLSELSQANIAQMLVRGKVAYLFNHYSLDYKTNTLAVCMRTQQTGVTEIPDLINHWIDNNLGENAEERTQNLANFPIDPLFVIFTWWNTQLEFKEESANFDPTEKIQSQFRILYRQEVISDKKWPGEWIYRNGALTKFTNCYLLRDFKESKTIFSNKRDAQNNNNVEVQEQLHDPSGRLMLHEDKVAGVPNPFFGTKAQRNYHKVYFDEFVKFHQGNEGLFDNPEQSFLESSIPGKDGSEYIIKNLVPVSSNTVSVPIYLNVLNKALANAQKELEKHHHSDNADEQIRKAAKDGSDIQLRMNVVFGIDAFYFGSFIEHLIISENEVLEFYHQLLRSEKPVSTKDYNKYILLRAKSTRLDENKSYEENLEILRQDYHKDSAEETAKHFEEVEGIDLNELFFGELYNLQNNSVLLAREARRHWIASKLDPERFSFFIEKGLDKGLLTRLFDNLVVSFDRLKIVTKIAEEIREFVDSYQRTDEAEGMIAHITAGKINEFINAFGWSYCSAAEKEKLRETNHSNDLKLVFPDDQRVFRSLDRVQQIDSSRMSVEKLMDYMDNLTKNLNKKPIDMETLQYIPMIRNYQRWSELMRISFIANCDIPTYDVAANEKLGRILDKIKEYNFTIA